MLKICFWAALCCQINPLPPPPPSISAGRPSFGNKQKHSTGLGQLHFVSLPSHLPKTQTDGQRVKRDDEGKGSGRMMEERKGKKKWKKEGKKPWPEELIERMSLSGGYSQ